MKVTTLPLDKITPYARNPRKNAAAVATVKASLKEYGWQQPLVIDAEGVIIAGHTRYLAAMELGWTMAPVHVAADLTPAQAKAYRIMDNRSHERAEWDMELLALEIDDLKTADFDLDLTGFDEGELAEIDLEDHPQDEGNYSRKIEAPIYEPNGDQPPISALIDETKTDALKAEIRAKNLPDDISGFLIKAAERHTVFNFREIANYYPHADSVVQDLMERSALIIIDFNRAIEEGFVKLSEAVAEQYAKDYPDEG